jgi:hypothetical protein
LSAVIMLPEQRPVDAARDDVRALHAGADRLDRVREVGARIAAQVHAAAEQPLRLVRAQLRQDLAAGVGESGVGEEDELGGAQRRGGRDRDVLHREVEHLAGRRVADRGHDDDVAGVEAARDRLRVHLAHGAGVLVVDAVVHAHRARGDEVPRDGVDRRARHRRVRQAEREQRVHLDAEPPDRGLHALERGRVGHPQALVVARALPARRELRLDLRARAVDEHDADAGAVQQVQVVRERHEAAFGDQLAAEGDHERAAAEPVEIGRYRPEPGHEIRVGLGRHGACVRAERGAF